MGKIQIIKNKYSCKYSTAHYEFYFSKGSVAQKKHN